MKKLILFTVIAVYLLFATAMIFDSNKSQNSVIEIKYNPSIPETIPQTESEELYVLKNVNGIIAVEDALTGNIIKKTDTLVSILPEKDRKMLKKGIRVKDDRELTALLEDFCS